MNSAELERIWFRTQSREWRTLAIVPTDAATNDGAFAMTKLLILLGAQHADKLSLADFRNVVGARLASTLELVAWYVDKGERLVWPTKPIDENPATIAIARAADRVLLCATLGETSMRTLEDVIQQIGRERFLGTVLFRTAGPTSRSRTEIEVRPVPGIELSR